MYCLPEKLFVFRVFFTTSHKIQYIRKQGCENVRCLIVREFLGKK